MENLNYLTSSWTKTSFLIFVLICITVDSISQMPAAISIEPPNATINDEITLTFDPDEACFESGSLAGLPSISMHSGVCLEGGQTWVYAVEYNETGANGQLPTLLPTGDGRFSITYTPLLFYGLTGQTVTQICAVFNNGINWSQDGRDFDDWEYCMDFFIPLSYVPGDTLIEFKVNMNKAIYDNLFLPETDYVYIEFVDSVDYLLYDEDQDGIYSEYVYDNVIVGYDYEYIFRINSNTYEDDTRVITPQFPQTYVSVWWNNDTLGQINYIVDMSYQIELEVFNPVYDFVDLAGTMNNWEGSEAMEEIGNGLYFISYPSSIPGVVEYKFRINGDWATSEFPNAGPNRMTWSLNYPITLNHFYDDYNTDAWLATFEVDMNNEIEDGNFNPLTDYLDISGTFNGWDGHNILFDRDWTGNGIYTTNLLIDKNFPYIEFKFRINGNWDTGEFPEWGPNRDWTVLDTTGGLVNLFECVYNLTDVPYPPYVYFLSIQGELVAGNEVFGDYTYMDPNWDEEGESIYQWYTANNPYGITPEPIDYAINQSLLITENEIGSYLVFEVRPVSATGNPANGDSVIVVSDMIVVTGKEDIKMVPIRIYPNPASSVLNVEGCRNLMKIEFYNLTGQKISEVVQTGNELISIIVADCNSGLYIVKCTDKSNQHYNFKFIKN